MRGSRPTSDQEHARAIIEQAARFLESLAALTADHEMPMQQIQLLLQLYLRGEVEQQELPKYTRVERSANSRNVRKLGPGERPHLRAGPGYVESYDYPMDQRLKIVRLTPRGRAVLEGAAIRAQEPE